MPRLESVLAESLRLREDQVSDNLSMKTSEYWDSLTHMELISALEQTYGIELTRDDIVAMTDVASIRRILQSKQAAA